MHIRVYQELNIDTLHNNYWDKLFYLNDQNPDLISKTHIRCNRKIEVNSQELAKIKNTLIKTDKHIRYEKISRYNTQEEAKSAVQFFASNIPYSHLTPCMQDMCNHAAPAGYQFREIGWALNSQEKVDKFGRVPGKIEIRYVNKEYPNQFIILNLHIHYAPHAYISKTLNQMKKSLKDFQNDSDNLKYHRDIVTIDNFKDNGFVMDDRSLSAIIAYSSNDPWIVNNVGFRL